jgi:hypothetical protein
VEAVIALTAGAVPAARRRSGKRMGGTIQPIDRAPAAAGSSVARELLDRIPVYPATRHRRVKQLCHECGDRSREGDGGSILALPRTGA